MKKFAWLIRRELWESRTVWIAPAICAAVIIVGVLIASFRHGSIVLDGDGIAGLPQLGSLTAAKAEALASLALGGIAMPFVTLVLFTQFFYALDALYGDRRDRSILFWKSLPVSDTESVLAKLTVAALVFPLVTFAAALATQLAVFMIVTVKLAPVTALAGHLWNPVAWAGSILVMCYTLVARAIWYLPLLGWALLASAWAPRSPLMWAALPPLALGLLEWIVFRSHYLWYAIGERAGNSAFFGRAFGLHGGPGGWQMMLENNTVTGSRTLVDMMRPAEFFANPELWTGVLVAAGLVAAAIWVRRYRDASI